MRLPENRRYSMGVPKKSFFGHPSRIDDFPCNLTQFCYITGFCGGGHHKSQTAATYGALCSKHYIRVNMIFRIYIIGGKNTS